MVFSEQLPETGYYETYNWDNVELVDAAQTPIVRVTATGIQTSDELREFDVIVYAGFDAFTGADQIDIQGAQTVSGFVISGRRGL